MSGPIRLFENDIAVIITDEFYINEYDTGYVRPAMLPKIDTDPQQGFGLISGFGLESNDDEPAHLFEFDLHLAYIWIQDQNTCHYAQNKIKSGDMMTSNQLCAGGHGTGTCRGDSGGPLVVAMKNKWTLVGVTSMGRGNCTGDHPYNLSVFTKVSSYLDFIHYSEMKNIAYTEETIYGWKYMAKTGWKYMAETEKKTWTLIAGADDCWDKCDKKDGECSNFCGFQGFCCSQEYGARNNCPAKAIEALKKLTLKPTYVCIRLLNTANTTVSHEELRN